MPPLAATFLASLTVNGVRVALENLNTTNTVQDTVQQNLVNSTWFSNCCDQCICSPNYPEPYPEGLDITWNLTAPAGRTLVLWVIEFEIFARDDNMYYDDYFTYDYGDSTDCDDGDYIDIEGVDTDAFDRKRSNLKLLDDDTLRMCGYNDPKQYPLYAIYSATNNQIIKFHTTTGSKSAQGFKAIITDDTGAYNINQDISYVLTT